MAEHEVGRGEPAELVLTVENQHGLHARPAAAFVRTASRFQSAIEIANLTSGRGPVPARSLTSLALLQVRKGDRIQVSARGSDSDAALLAIGQLAADGFGEKTQPERSSAPSPRTTEPAPSQDREPVAHMGGIGGSDGIAIGPLELLQDSFSLEDDSPSGDPAAELANLTAAMNSVRRALVQSYERPAVGDAAPGAEILEAQALILGDPVLLSRLEAVLGQKHISAASAWIEITTELASQYQDMDDPYLRERAADVRDIARRVLKVIKGAVSSSTSPLDRPSILFVPEFLPSDAALCDPTTVLGVITRSGSATCHSAIILRTLGIPMVVGVSGFDEKLAQGKTIAMDGATGEIWLDPDTDKRSRGSASFGKSARSGRGRP